MRNCATYCKFQNQHHPPSSFFVALGKNKMSSAIRTITTMRAAGRPFILLFGDSITEQGFGMEGNTGWASLLAADYSRRADVFNRGYFGYNSKHAVENALPSVVPLLQNTNDELLFSTVYFGANDATTPGSRQYISEAEYASNLTKIINTIRESCSSKNNQQLSSSLSPIILMTPPPLHDEAWANFKGLANRSNERHFLYGKIVKEVAQKHDQCSILDVWSLLDGSTSPSIYGKYLTDGLHLNDLGNRAIYSGLLELLQKDYPGVLPRQNEADQTGVPLQGKLWDELR